MNWAAWSLAPYAQDRPLRTIFQRTSERLRDRSISIADLNQLRLRIESQPEVPERDWYKDLESFKICGRSSYPKTFLLATQTAHGVVL
jgi:hypothetical protein